MKQLVLTLFLLCISLAFGLECVNCGVFLSAPTSQCRGKVSNTSCAPENVGCLTITGQNQVIKVFSKPKRLKDGTYYVEKRCAFKSEDREEGCGEISIRG